MPPEKDVKPGDGSPGDGTKPADKSVKNELTVEDLQKMTPEELQALDPKVLEKLDLETLEAGASLGDKIVEDDKDPNKNPAPAKKPDEVIDPPKKTPIPDDLKLSMGIPAKFKFWEDVVGWGSNAEKEMGQANSKVDLLENDIKESKVKIEELQELVKAKPTDPEITKEMLEEANEKLRNAWDKDPTGTMKKLLTAERTKQKEAEASRELELKKQDIVKQKEEYFARLDVEEAELKKKYSAEDWLELSPKIREVAKQRPHLKSWAECLLFVEYNESLKKAELQRETDKKATEKKKALVESGGSIPKPSSDDLASKIKNAKTEKELDDLMEDE